MRPAVPSLRHAEHGVTHGQGFDGAQVEVDGEEDHLGQGGGRGVRADVDVVLITTTPSSVHAPR